MSNTDSRVAIVTGATGCIGRTIAEHLAGSGLRVVVHYHSNKDEADSIVESIHNKGGDSLSVGADISSTDDVEKLFAQTTKTYGRVDVVVNNAAPRLGDASPVAETTEAQFDRFFNTVARGTFLMLRKAAQCLEDNGSIINISSTMTGMTVPGYAAFAGSKAAVERFTLVLAAELGPRGIRVNCIAPGFIDTEELERNRQQPEQEQLVQKLIKMTPLGRLGETGDVAGAISLLISEKAYWINGQIIRVNGGLI